MRSSQDLVLKSRFDDIMDISITRDLPELRNFIKQSISTAFRFQIFKDLRVYLPVTEIPRTAVKLISPQFNSDNLFVVVRTSSCDAAFKPDTIYFKWEYQDYQGIKFIDDTYQDIEATIEIDKLLTT